MHIGFPVENLLIGKSGGLETYARNLISSLQKVDQSNDYVLFCSILNEEAFPIANNNFRKIISGKYKYVEKFKLRILPFAGKVLEFMEDTRYLRDIKKVAKHIALNTIRFFSPPKESLNEHMYDMLHYMLTEFFSGESLVTRSHYHKCSAEKADIIIAISRFTKKTLVEKYDIPEDKIIVVYEGYDSAAFKKIDKEIVNRFKENNNLPDRFLFYPAATWAHKNHLNLLKAYRILIDRYKIHDNLLLTGIKMENHKAVEEEIDRLGLHDKVIYLGYLPYEELPLIYNAASIMVFPSLFEGFGLPVIEAMAAGLPVSCSNTTSLPEIGGDAVLYFDPEQPDDIAETIFKIHSDRDLRDSLIKKGFERAASFSWERTATETLKVYEHVYRNFKK
jgi:glycosyltransferase involved in cell wall biosynthesis